MIRPVPQLAGLGTAAALVACLSGCGAHAQRRAAATDVCVGALPVAQAVVGPRARLVHLKRLSARDADALRFGDPLEAAPSGSGTSPGGPPAAAVCALAYRGTFDSARLPAAVHPTGRTGPVLVLLVTVRHPRVVDALVRPDLPRQLVH